MIQDAKVIDVKNITIEFMKRFNTHLGYRNDIKTQRLRKYIKSYYKLIEKFDVFVPRLFVLWFGSSSYISSCIVWPINIYAIFPPTDFVFLCGSYKCHKTDAIFSLIETEKLVLELSSYLYDLNGYEGVKILRPEYECSEDIQEKLISVSSPMDDSTAVIMVDSIPRFEESKIISQEDRLST
jgi:hypothetical protein